jgi:cobalamin biosynthesis protein CobW
MSRLAPALVRAKGILRFSHQPEKPVLFQLVGQRAAVSPAPATPPGSMPCRLVLIAASGALDRAAVSRLLASCEDRAPGDLHR